MTSDFLRKCLWIVLLAPPFSASTGTNDDKKTAGYKPATTPVTPRTAMRNKKKLYVDQLGQHDMLSDEIIVPWHQEFDKHDSQDQGNQREDDGLGEELENQRLSLCPENLSHPDFLHPPCRARGGEVHEICAGYEENEDCDCKVHVHILTDRGGIGIIIKMNVPQRLKLCLHLPTRRRIILVNVRPQERRELLINRLPGRVLIKQYVRYILFSAVPAQENVRPVVQCRE